MVSVLKRELSLSLRKRSSFQGWLYKSLAQYWLDVFIAQQLLRSELLVTKKSLSVPASLQDLGIAATVPCRPGIPQNTSAKLLTFNNRT